MCLLTAWSKQPVLCSLPKSYFIRNVARYEYYYSKDGCLHLFPFLNTLCTSAVHLDAQYFKRCKTSHFLFITSHEIFMSTRKLLNVYGVWTVMMNEVFMNHGGFGERNVCILLIGGGNFHMEI